MSPSSQSGSVPLNLFADRLVLMKSGNPRIVNRIDSSHSRRMAAHHWRKSGRRKVLLPFAVPDLQLDDTVVEEIQDTLTSGCVANGPKTSEFESEFAKFVGVKYAIAVESLVVAQQLALAAAGVKQNEEVVSTPFAFSGVPEATAHLGARPVFIDIEPGSLNMDPNLLEDAITENTRAIIPVHVAGLPSDLKRIHQTARRHNLTVIENASQAFPAKYNGRMIGQFSDITSL